MPTEVWLGRGGVKAEGEVRKVGRFAGPGKEFGFPSKCWKTIGQFLVDI